MSDKVKVRFDRASHYRRVPVTGVWGGVSPTGSVCADFFVEYRRSPDELTMQVDGPKLTETGRIGETDAHDNPIYMREAQVGVVFKPEDAYAVGLWLIEKAKVAGFRTPEDGVH